MHTTKHSLLTSVTALLLCFVMLLGTTFAWFTDTATSANNIIKAGNLDIGMYWSSDNVNWFNAEADNAPAVFHQDKWEPGYTEVRYIKVTNNGSLSFKYQMAINPTDLVGKLAEVIDVSFDIVTGNDAFVAPTATNKQGSLSKIATLKELIDANGIIAGGVLLPATETAAGYYSGEIVICVSFHMDELAGNEYQGKSIGSDFGINLYATQFDYENDSFDSSYDDDAEWPGIGLNESASTKIDSSNLMLGALTSEVTINGGNFSATIPADVKVADGATSLDLTVKDADGDSNITLGDGESAVGFDVHISGIAADNTQPMTVNLGAVLPMGLTDTELKLYHTENGTPVLMTRVNSAADFAIHNQYTYNAETGEVSIYVASFSVFSAVKTSPDEWKDDTVADTSWYTGHENDSEYLLDSVADFLGFRDLVDGGNTFEGKTVKLGVDIDLDGDNKRLFNPIGGGWAYLDGNTFNGTFDGQNHTIYNIYINGWELDATGDQHSETSKGAGLFSSIHNATIKNLAISGAEMVVETTSIGVVVGCAQGVCTFENIVVTKANLGNYQMRNGGIVGDIYITEADAETPRIDGTYTHVFKNVTVDSSVKLSSMWGDFDTGNGGVIGGRYGNTQILMQDVNVACQLDVFSDVTAAYQWYAYRRCGMLIGYTGQNSPKKATNAAADFLTCENVNVFYGDWVNYTYYQFADQDSTTGQRYPWVRAEAGEYTNAFSNPRYGVPTYENGAVKIDDSNKDTYKTDYAAITFNQLYGGGQGVYGTNDHEGKGVTICKISELATTTVKFQNIENWDNVKIEYFFAHGDNTWSTLVDGLSATSITSDGTFDVYTFNIPSIAHSFIITGTNNGDVSTEQFKLSSLTANEIYSLYNGELVKTRKVTLTSVDTWKVDGARFALYAFDQKNNTIWFNLISSDNANYCCYLPVNYTGAVACRMDGAVSENNWDNKWNKTPDISLPTDGSDYTYTLKLYFKPNSNWTQSSARFAAYFFNNSTGKNLWVNMTDNDGDGVYECEIPSGKWEKMIFCRFKGTSTTNGWNSNMWNQTNDLEFFGEKIYYVWDGAWSNGNGHWENIVN